MNEKETKDIYWNRVDVIGTTKSRKGKIILEFKTNDVVYCFTLRRSNAKFIEKALRAARKLSETGN